MLDTGRPTPFALPQADVSVAWYDALTLKERLIHAPLPSSPERGPIDNLDLATFRLKRWKDMTPFRNHERLFAERLETEQLTGEILFSLLAESADQLRERVSQPAWFEEIEQALSAGRSDMFEYLSTLDLSEQAIQQIEQALKNSFLILVRPFILHGIQRLQMGLKMLIGEKSALPCTWEQALVLWVQHLPMRLIPLVSRVLTLELHVARLEGSLQGETAEERFQDFIQQIKRPESQKAILEEYAPLTRLVCGIVRYWVDYGLEFFRHLGNDWEKLQIVLGCSPSGKNDHNVPPASKICPDSATAPPADEMLVEVKCGVGDQHRQGRSTILLRFASGLQLVYKPRSLSIDAHFQELLSWLNERGNQPAFRTIRILDCGHYGWSEFVEATECQSYAEVERFYERQGAYLALLYVLGAVDVHYENLIASGEHPVLIDLESLFHPQMHAEQERGATMTLLHKISSSVLSVGLLPIRLWANEHSEGIDLSGLGGQEGQKTPRPVLQFVNAGTDQMHLIRQCVEMPAQHNRPHITEQSIHLLDHYTQLEKGFRAMYIILMQQGEALQAGPLRAFAQDSIRVIIRPTNTYAHLLHESTHPHLLRHTLDRERFFDQLWQQVPAKPHLKVIIPAEVEDLHAFDIPIFTTTPSTRDIYTSKGASISNFRLSPPLEEVKARLNEMNTRDLERQLWFMQASLATTQLQPNRHIASTRSPQVTLTKTVTQEQLLHEARKIGKKIEQMALRENGEAQWPSLTPVNKRAWEITTAGADLYNGVAGIAFFLAYLSALTGDKSYRMLAQEAARTVQKQMKHLQSMKLLGAFSGWGGIIYLYTHLGVLWQEPEWFQWAEEAIEQSLIYIEEDTMLDLMAGNAGYILALLGLDEVWPSPLAVTTAMQAGDYLISALKKLLMGGPGEFGIEATKPLTGLSHGASGIALSLLRLALRTGEASYREAALTAIEYERSVFSSERQNWPDFRVLDTAVSISQAPPSSHDKRESYMTAWCHGAAGVGMARLASLSSLDDATTREEIAIAIKTTLKEGFGWSHSLCHGDLGNLELLLKARIQFDDQNYEQDIQRLLGFLFAEMEQQGYITGVPLGLEVPGLMVGIAGMGYMFLRATQPERVPSLLTLEPPIK